VFSSKDAGAVEWFASEVKLRRPLKFNQLSALTPSLLMKDPYVKGGLVLDWSVREWTVVIEP